MRWAMLARLLLLSFVFAGLPVFARADDLIEQPGEARFSNEAVCFAEDQYSVGRCLTIEERNARASACMLAGQDADAKCVSRGGKSSNGIRAFFKNGPTDSSCESKELGLEPKLRKKFSVACECKYRMMCVVPEPKQGESGRDRQVSPDGN